MTHREAMSAPIPRESLHRISDIDGFAPREQAAQEDLDLTAEAALSRVEVVLVAVAIAALLVIAYGSASVLLPILVAVGSGL